MRCISIEHFSSYSVEERLIRIHAALDRPFVPRFFIDWIANDR